MDVKMALRRWKRDERDKCRLVLFLFSLGGVQKPHAATTTSGAIAGQTLHHRTRLPFWVTAGADIALDAANDDQQRESDLIVRQSVRRSTSHGSPPDVDIHNMAGVIGALDSPARLRRRFDTVSCRTVRPDTARARMGLAERSSTRKNSLGRC